MCLVWGDLPSGTVTFLFTDVEGSTRLLHELGAERYGDALAEHRRIVRDAFQRHGGVEVDTQGDAFLVAFASAPKALRAAAEAQEALVAGPIRVRMGLHTGTPHLAEEGYVGIDVHRAARIAAAGYGGQVLVSAATAGLVGEGLRDLGEHRLKDLAAGERLYQLGEGEFPALKSLHRTNLPVPATPFVGRARELAEARALLDQGRLLTLTGPGGSGKTRLAMQLAADAGASHPDGVFWVPLASLTDPSLVLEAAGRAVQSRNGLAEHVGDKSLLLLLDNFEHLVDAAGDLPRLLASCPNLRLLVTSREVLRLPGEQAYPVPPLDLADAEELFVGRARAADPAFVSDDSLGELCERLEQLPLALELAAARVRVLSPEQLLERLSQRLDLLRAGRGADPRQQTLRATIEWSHELLDGDEQRLFARLAVFRGGCTLEAAERVCEAYLNVLESLVDKSLVRVRDGSRFWMLETIRDFALERLEALGEAEELRQNHAAYFFDLSEEAEPGLLGVDPKPWLDRLEPEQDNIRAALDKLEQSGQTERALRMAGAIFEFWCLRNHWGEGWRRLQHLLELDETPTPARARAMAGAAHLAPHAGPDAAAAAREQAEAAIELQRQEGDPWGIAFAELQLVQCFVSEERYAEALPLCEAGVERMREVGDVHRTLQALQGLGWCCYFTGDVDRAVAVAEELLRDARSAGDRFLETGGLAILSTVARDEGRLADSLALLAEAHPFFRDFGSPMLVALELLGFAATLDRAGQAEPAAKVLAAAEAHRERAGTAYPPFIERLTHRPTLESVREALDEEEFARVWEEGTPLSADEALALAQDAMR